MTTKRKLTYEQDLALQRGRNVARAHQRARVAAKQADERAQAERDRAAREHEHVWSHRGYTDDYTNETHACRVCGATETRPVNL